MGFPSILGWRVAQENPRGVLTRRWSVTSCQGGFRRGGGTARARPSGAEPFFEGFSTTVRVPGERSGVRRIRMTDELSTDTVGGYTAGACPPFWAQTTTVTPLAPTVATVQRREGGDVEDLAANDLSASRDPWNSLVG